VEVNREEGVKAEFEEMLQGLRRFLQMRVKAVKAEVTSSRQREAKAKLELKECEAEAKSRKSGMKLKESERVE
jgi:hypothetical protein